MVVGINKQFKKILVLFLVNLVIILLFTLFDYIIHSLSEEYAVPSYYFRNKIIFGTIIGFIVLMFTNKLNPSKKALLFSLVVSTLLQVRYYLEGYPKKFVFEFLFIHFIILLSISFFVLKFFNNALLQKN